MNRPDMLIQWKTRYSLLSAHTVSTQDGSYVQYVDSELYATTTGQESSQM